MDKKSATKPKSMKLVYHKKIGLVFVVVCFVFFFARLFIPTQSLFMIPDFGESDVMHLNIPLKQILSGSLKSHQWPVWTKHLDNGFPILAEGQIGTFYLPNLLLFRFLPLVTAYNLNLVISFCLAVVGTYLFSRSLKLSKTASLLSTFVFTFSGFFVVHLNHFNLIQAVSLTPLLFWAFVQIFKKPTLPKTIFFSFLLCQQIFTGHFYIVFITCLGLFVFLLLNILFQHKIRRIKKESLANKSESIRAKISKFKILAIYFLGIILAFVFASIQLLPTFELWLSSSRSKGLDFETITSFPYPPKHLLTFLDPYGFGSPATGTYPAFSSDWGIFWENTSYIGLVPLALVIISLNFFKNKKIKTFWVISAISILLVFGKYSPIYFVFSFFPFNMFRVPSKFLLLTTLALSILAGFSFEEILKVINKRVGKWGKIFFPALFTILIFFLITVDLYKFSYNYPPVTPAKWWTDDNQAAEFLSKNQDRITSVGAPIFWNKVFLTSGWIDMKAYKHFRSYLYPNYNLFFSQNQTSINTGGLKPRRNIHLTRLMSDISYNKQSNVASISAISENLLSLFNSRFFISSFDFPSNLNLVKVKEIHAAKEQNLDPIYIYENNNYLKRVYLSFESEKVTTLQEVQRQLAQKDFLENNLTLVENDLELKKNKSATGSAKIMSDGNQEVIIETNSDSKSILILADSFDNNWKVLVDGKKQEILRVNFNQKGVFLNAGKHKVRFYYRSWMFETGKIITTISFVISVLALFLYLSFFPHKASDNT